MKEHKNHNNGFGSYKYLRIPYYDNYIIDIDGNIYYLDDNADWQIDYVIIPIKIMGNQYNRKVILNGNEEDANKIYLHTWFGINNFDYELSDEGINSVKAIIPIDFINLTNSGIDEINWNGIVYKKCIINHLIYYVSEYGSIYSTYLRRLIKYASHNCMHIKVKLGTHKSIYVHRLVYDLFVGIKNMNNEIDHLISTSRHHYTELEEVKPDVNKQRYYESNGKLTPEDIHFICKSMEDNIDGHKIFENEQLKGKIKDYLTFSDLCTHIKRGKSWKKIGSLYKVTNYDPKSHSPNASISTEDVRSIYLQIKNGISCTQLAKEYGISVNTIYRIRDKKFFKHILNDL